MADEVKHKFTTTLGDGADGAKLSQSHVEDGHVATLGSDGQVIVRDSSLTEGAAWLWMHSAQVTRGLLLRTHPDADLAASRVMLVKADEVVMDDGQRVTSGMAGLVANIAAAGAGGLDTGAEAADVWYEIYLIRKPADGTLALLFHRALDWFEDEASTAGEDGQYGLRRVTAPNREQLGQEFQVDTTGLCPFADLRLIRVGAVSGRVWIEIRTDSSGLPSTTVLATSDKIDASLINTTQQWMRFIFRTPASLTAATSYHLVLLGDYTPSDTVGIGWRADTTAATYRTAAISMEEYDGAVWTATTDDDFLFRLSIERNLTAITYPSGYAQKALLGYVNNDGSSNFRQFVAKDRLVRLVDALNTGVLSNTVPDMSSFAATVPAIPLAQILCNLSNNTSASKTLAAGAPDGYSMIVDSLRGGAIQAIAPAGGDLPMQVGGWIAAEYQGVHYMVSANSGRIWILGYRW